jgi:hypothetical protein
MTATTTKTGRNNRIVRARFADDLDRPQTRESLRALQWEKKFSSQQKGPFSTPTQESWNIARLLDAKLPLGHPGSFCSVGSSESSFARSAIEAVELALLMSPELGAGRDLFLRVW